MRYLYKTVAVALVAAATPFTSIADDPVGTVESWSEITAAPKILDINFSETLWPNTWGNSGTGKACPEFKDGVYVNTVLTAQTVGENQVAWPLLFHNCAFATADSNDGFGVATAAFARQYFDGEKATNRNDWTEAGHTVYLEDNIEYDAKGRPIKGLAGFVQMCRGAGEHGWMEIDHIPYIHTLQWSWSSTSWGRGIKLDIKIGDGEWQPLVWAGSEKQKQGWTVYSDQGYFMENVIDKHDVSLRWRVWDGDGKQGADDQVQKAPFDWQPIDPNAQRQAPRVHKIKIYGDPLTQADADRAKENPGGDIGEPTDMDNFGYKDPTTIVAPDENAETVLYRVDQNGDGDYTTVQGAIDAIPEGMRGIILIAPGVYDENIYAGRKGEYRKFISLIGTDPETTILTSSVTRGGGDKSYTDCAALNVFSERFYAEGITIRNTAGNNGQAEALFTSADAHIFNNVRLEGFQDTYKANGGARGYFVNSTISGATDFIYDGGLEWFENCEIICLSGGQYITAPAEATINMTQALYPLLSTSPFHGSLFFSNCDVTPGKGVSAKSYYLGRPWKENSGSMFLNCRLGNHIKAAGWSEWGGSENSASFFEYKNLNADGTAVNTSGRVKWSHQATDDEVEAYINPEFLFALASKVPFDYAAILRGVAAPTGFAVAPGLVTWETNPEAAGYIVMRGGEAVAFSAEASYALPDGVDASEISVKSVSRHGVTSAAVSASSAMRVKAFPTAEGFGKYTTGGRGGRVVKVTSLADDGSEGTLRWAFEQYKNEPITILFTVNGDITLNGELRVNRSNWTLAGQSAPGQGIVITHHKVNFGGSTNFIVRNVRFRVGQKNTAGDIIPENAVGAENCANFIFDHCSFGWSVEENMNTADSHFLTVQHSMIHEGLFDAGHSKGARGYGCQWGGSPATYHHNLLAHNNSRSPRFNGARGEDFVVFMEYINNVNYNYGKLNCYGGENSADIANYNGLNSAHELNFIGNYYKPGPHSDKTKVTFIGASDKRDGATSWAPAKYYLEGNVAEGFPLATANNWTAMSSDGWTLDEIRSDERIVTKTPWYKWTAAGNLGQYVPEEYMIFDYQDAYEAFNTVVDHAGTINRDQVESRVAEDVRSGKATYGGSLGKKSGILDTPADAEGYFAYPTDYTVPTDTDGDGMPDEWEKAHGLDPQTADNNLMNAEGYTALEAYLNSIMGELTVDGFTESGVNGITVDNGIVYDSAADTLRVSPESIGAVLEVFALNGAVVERKTLTGTEASLSALPSGVYLLRVSSPTLAPAVLKIAR